MAYQGIIISVETTSHSSLYVGNSLSDNIARVLNTTVGERMGNPQFGSRVKAFFFDPDNIPVFTVENEIKSSLERWIPYISVMAMESNFQDGIYNCSLTIRDNSIGVTIPLTVNFV